MTRSILLLLMLVFSLTFLSACVATVRSYPGYYHSRVWVPGHYAYGPSGYPHWIRGHYEYR